MKKDSNTICITGSDRVCIYPVKMMPGQIPYTEAELKILYRLVIDAIRAYISEQDEVECKV